MSKRVAANYRRVQLKLAVIFSAICLLIIGMYTLMVTRAHRRAQFDFQQHLRRSLTGEPSERPFEQIPICQPPEPPYDASARREGTDVGEVVRQSGRFFDRRFYSNLAIFDLVTWLAVSVAGYFFSGWLLGPVRRAADEQEEFLANASHELKTPITTIKTELSLLEKEKMPVGVRESWRVIAGETAALQALVEKLLVSVSHDQQSDPPETIELAAFLKPLAARLERVYRERGLGFVVVVAESLMVTTKRDQLGQIVELLLDNAGKYATPGTRVQLAARREGEVVVIEVINEGLGVGAGEREAIWQRFYRVTDKNVQSQPGSGLGLAIARELAASLGGQLTLADGAAAHTVFRLTLSDK